MSLAERQSAERWQLTGVDLDTRRRRVLEELALKGRTEEQARFLRGEHALDRAPHDATRALCGADERARRRTEPGERL